MWLLACVGLLIALGGLDGLDAGVLDGFFPRAFGGGEKDFFEVGFVVGEAHEGESGILAEFLNEFGAELGVAGGDDGVALVAVWEGLGVEYLGVGLDGL